MPLLTRVLIWEMQQYKGVGGCDSNMHAHAHFTEAVLIQCNISRLHLR